MFLKKVKSRGRTYLSLVESYRENGKVKHRTLMSFGREDQLKKQPQLMKIVKLISEPNADSMFDIYSMEEVNRINWGVERIYRALWKKIKMDKILDEVFLNTNVKFDFKEAIFLEVASRIIDPCSKRKLFYNQDKYHGISNVSLHNLYRVLDYLSFFQSDIETALFEENKESLNICVDVVFYDVTTLYFESVRSDDLRNFGFSKDHKFGEVQVVLGLLVDMEGRPILCNIFPGNTFESKTLENILISLRKKFKIRKATVVADRGINSKINLKKIKECGFEYIVGCRLKSMKKNIQKEALNIDEYENFGEEDNLKFKVIEYDNTVEWEDDDGCKRKEILKERIFCTWSAKRAVKDRKDRERLINKAEKMLVGNAIYDSKKGAKRYIKTTNNKPRSIGLDVFKIAEDAIWDGFYGIQSSDQNITKEEVLDAYHCLWRIEESFKVMKSALEIRPMFHWTSPRVRGHIVLCFLAFLLYRTLEIELNKAGVKHSPARIKEAFEELEASVISVDDKKYVLRSPFQDLARSILEVLEISPPPSVSSFQEFCGHLS